MKAYRLIALVFFGVFISSTTVTNEAHAESYVTLYYDECPEGLDPAFIKEVGKDKSCQGAIARWEQFNDAAAYHYLPYNWQGKRFQPYTAVS